jgi:hypothetical protein
MKRLGRDYFRCHEKASDYLLLAILAFINTAITWNVIACRPSLPMSAAGGIMLPLLTCACLKAKFARFTHLLASQRLPKPQFYTINLK